MPAAPSSPPSLPSVDISLPVPERLVLTARRSNTVTGALRKSASHSSRPARSSPLAGPSIDGVLLGAATVSPSPEGDLSHLPSLAEVSGPSVPDGGPSVDVRVKIRRRRTLTSVFSKLSFPSSSSSLESGAEPCPSPEPAGSPPRRRRVQSARSSAPVVPSPTPSMPAVNDNSSTSRPVLTHAPPPSPTGSLGSPRRAPLARAGTSSRRDSRTLETQAEGSHRSAAPSADSGQSITQAGARPVSSLMPPSTSSAEWHWLTQSAPPRFSRAGLKAQGVVMPVSAREARRRSMVSQRMASLDTVSTPSPARIPSRPKSVCSPALSPPSPPSPSFQPNTPHLGSRTSSFVSESSGDISVDYGPPSLSTTSSASDISSADLPADEMGVVANHVQIQVNDVPVDAIGIPKEAHLGFTDMGGPGRKARDYDIPINVHVRPAEQSSIASAGSIGTIGTISSVGSVESRGSGHATTRSHPSSTGSLGAERPSVVTFRVDPSPLRQARPATAPEQPLTTTVAKKRERSRSMTIRKVWRQVVRTVSLRHSPSDSA